MKSNQKIVKHEKPFPLSGDALVAWCNSPSGRDGSIIRFLENYYKS